MVDQKNAMPKTELLSNRLERLEVQIGRLSDLIAQQAVAKKQRRRILTLRFVLASFVVFAAFFAWVASSYHESQRQAQAVDQLVSESAFVYYQPRDSAVSQSLTRRSDAAPDVLGELIGR